jgi:hypothetical protein
MPPAQQSYANHLHRPLAAAVAFFCTVAALVAQVMRWAGAGGAWTEAVVRAGVLGALLALAVISRVYVTRLQDRIIRLEMRVRAGTVLTPEQQQMLAALTIKQVAALRFASDAELGPLVERAARERLKPDAIKRAVRYWQPDLDRT